MKIFLACPQPAYSRQGNRVTAGRWATLLQQLGHRLQIGTGYQNEKCDLMVALHARKSYPAIRAFRSKYPQGPLILCLTGTDLYSDLPENREAQESLGLADRLVVLQPLAKDQIPDYCHPKIRVILQSSLPVKNPPNKYQRRFQGCVLGHLRDEKDPLCAAQALHFLPNDSRIHIVQAGKALTPDWEKQARTMMEQESRYTWLGEIPRGQARRCLARSHFMIISSRLEGGANVVSEAIVQKIPILASHIPGNVGLLGEKYPGYFRVGDPQDLADKIHRLETDSIYFKQLETWCRRLAPQFQPRKEKKAWKDLLRELMGEP